MNEEQLARMHQLKLQNEFTTFMGRIYPYQGHCQIKECNYNPYMHCSVAGTMYNISIEVTTSLCLAHYLEYEYFVTRTIRGDGVRWLWGR